MSVATGRWPQSARSTLRVFTTSQVVAIWILTVCFFSSVAATTGAAMTPPRLRINLSPRLIAIRLLCLPPVPPSKTQDSVGRTVADAVNEGRKTQWIVTLGVEVDKVLAARRRRHRDSSPLP